MIEDKKNLINSMQTMQERGPGHASAFGGTGNNTNAAACSCNGNNSVANSNTNRGVSFALCYIHDTGLSDVMQNNNDSGSVVNKTEDIATTMDIQKAMGPESRIFPEMEKGNGNFHFQCDSSPLEVGFDDGNPDCVGNLAEIWTETQLTRGLAKKCKHKRLRGLKPFLLDRMIIRQAIEDAFVGKKPSGQMTWIRYHMDETVERMRHELATETFEIRPYRFRTIRSREGKTRHLAILGFYERCVQQLVKNVIQDKLRALEPRNVYSNLPGRGTLSNDARYCLYQQLRHDFKVYGDGYALKLDIRHCYESISVSLVERELFSYVSDAFTRRLVHRFFAHIKHLPIGDPLSGLFVNLVLRKWHLHFLNERHGLFDKCYFFCDDALFINKSSKSDLHQLRVDAEIYLRKLTGLRLKDNYKVSKLSEGVTFCGVRIFPYKIIPKQSTKKAMFHKRNNPRSLASYKGILDKTSSAHLSRVLEMDKMPEKIRVLNKKDA